MKTLYIECNMGVAGDMLFGALLDTLEEKKRFVDELNAIGIPNIEIIYKQDEKCGIVGTHVNVKVFGEEEQTGKLHHMHHNGQKGHSHHHSHITMESISNMIDEMNVAEQIKDDVKSIYQIIADAESKAHGKEVEQIHFHEVGTMDALADITGCCILIRKIRADRIVVSPVKTGYGYVNCAHGILPVPAPATATILTNIPSSAGGIEGELCTPTGAALIRYFADEFSYQPEMNIEKIGYGTGTKDFPVANCVRVMICDSGNENMETESDKYRTNSREADNFKDIVIELVCNIDDMTGEEIGYATEKIMEGKAVDVYTTPISMKKSRPGTKVSVLCKPKDKEEVIKEIFQYTTTIGIREYVSDRFILNRSEETRMTPLGEVRVKVSEGYGVKREKAEYKDLKNISETK